MDKPQAVDSALGRVRKFIKMHAGQPARVTTDFLRIERNLQQLRDKLATYEAADVPAPKPELPQGWGFPGVARRCHYFDDGSTEALCGKWGMFYGPRERPEARNGNDDCAACTRKLLARDAKGGAA